MCRADRLNYPSRVKFRLPRLHLALHALLLAVVALGIMLRPVLDIRTEVHLAEHAVGVGQDHQAVDVANADPGCVEDAGLERAHGLNHQEGSGGAYADLSVEMGVAVTLYPPIFGAAPNPVRLPDRYLATPFKPPIA